MDPPSPLTYHCALCQDRPSTYPSLGELHLHFRLWHPEQADDLQAAYAQSLASRAPQLLKVLEQAAQKTTTNSTSFAVQPCSSSTETSSVGGAGPSVERVLPTPLNPARPVHRPSPAASLTQDPARRLADAPQAGTLSVSVPPAPPMKEGPRVNDSRRRLSPSEYGPPPRPPPPSPPPPPPSTQPRAEMPAPNGSAHDLLCRKCPAGPGSKWFRTQSALEEHSRDTHRTGSAPTGSRPPASFACKLCPLSGQATKTFASEVVLIQHQETSHRQIQNRLTPSSRPSGSFDAPPQQKQSGYRCLQCKDNRVFANEAALEDHRVYKHVKAVELRLEDGNHFKVYKRGGTQNFFCPYCQVFEDHNSILILRHVKTSCRGYRRVAAQASTSTKDEQSGQSPERSPRSFRNDGMLEDRTQHHHDRSDAPSGSSYQRPTYPPKAADRRPPPPPSHYRSRSPVDGDRGRERDDRRESSSRYSSRRLYDGRSTRLSPPPSRYERDRSRNRDRFEWLPRSSSRSRRSASPRSRREEDASGWLNGPPTFQRSTEASQRISKSEWAEMQEVEDLLSL